MRECTGSALSGFAKNIVLVVGLGAAVVGGVGGASVAMAATHEPTTFTNVLSKGAFNTASNDSRSVVLTGGYPVRSIHVTGTLRMDVASNQSEALLLVTPPTGAPFLVQPSRVRVPGFGSTGEPAGSMFTYNDYVFPLNVPIGDAAGMWTFRFFEKNATGGASQDATWTSITITMDDAFVLPATAQTLAPAAGVYTEMEPNDDSFLSPNVINGMAPGESIVGASTSGTVYATPGLPGGGTLETADNFIMSTVPAPLGIYRYELTISSSGSGTWPAGGLMGTSQNLVYPTVGLALVGGGKGFVSFDAPDAFGISGANRVNGSSSPAYTAWYAFGKGERVSLRIAGAGNPNAFSYTATLARTSINPEVISAPLPAGVTTISNPDSTGGFHGWIYDANLEPLTNITITGGGFAAPPAALNTTLTAGTYYIATSDFFVNNIALGSNRNVEGVLPYPGVAVAPGLAFPAGVGFIINAGTPSETVVPAFKDNVFDIAWFKFTVGSPTCGADFNQVNGVTVQDIFDFLTAWLAGNAAADFNQVNGVTVQDIFDFLTAWLAGC